MEEDYLVSVRIDRRIILKWIFNRWNGEAWTELVWALVKTVMNLLVP